MQILPFARHNTTGKVVAPLEVDRGKACDCHCLFCEEPVVARQGAIKQPHFAHVERKETPCPASLERAILWMIERLFKEGAVFHTPDYAITLFDLDPQLMEEHDIARAKVVGYDQADVVTAASDQTLYVTLHTGRYALGVIASFEDAAAPSDWPTDRACLFLDLRPTTAMYHRSPEVFVESLGRFLSDSTSARRWIYHPREQVRRAAFAERVAKAMEDKRKAEAERVAREQRRLASGAGQRHVINISPSAAQRRVERMVKLLQRLYKIGHKKLYQCTTCLLCTSNTDYPCLYCGGNKWEDSLVKPADIDRAAAILKAHRYGEQSLKRVPSLKGDVSKTAW